MSEPDWDRFINFESDENESPEPCAKEANGGGGALVSTQTSRLANRPYLNESLTDRERGKHLSQDSLGSVKDTETVPTNGPPFVCPTPLETGISAQGAQFYSAQPLSNASAPTSLLDDSNFQALLDQIDGHDVELLLKDFTPDEAPRAVNQDVSSDGVVFGETMVCEIYQSHRIPVEPATEQQVLRVSDKHEPPTGSGVNHGASATYRYQSEAGTTDNEMPFVQNRNAGLKHRRQTATTKSRKDKYQMRQPGSKTKVKIPSEFLCTFTARQKTERITSARGTLVRQAERQRRSRKGAKKCLRCSFYKQAVSFCEVFFPPGLLTNYDQV